jgi:hypothetical protein
MADAAQKEAAFVKVEQAFRALADAVRELKSLGATEADCEARIGPMLDELEEVFTHD